MSNRSKIPTRLPTSRPDKPYTGIVVHVEVKVSEEGVAWIPVIEILEPEFYKGLLTTHPIIILIDKPESAANAAIQLSSYGLSNREMLEGNIPKILTGTRVQFHYRATKPPKRMLPEITIIKILPTVEEK